MIGSCSVIWHPAPPGPSSGIASGRSTTAGSGSSRTLDSSPYRSGSTSHTGCNIDQPTSTSSPRFRSWQSPEGRRNRVVTLNGMVSPPDIAALPFNRRVRTVGGLDIRAPPEGPYAWSRTLELNGIAGWAEVLLLDETGTSIVRSTPLPTVRLNARLVLGDSIYLLGQQVTTLDEVAVDLGELQFPIVVAVIDRATGATTVRVSSNRNRRATRPSSRRLWSRRTGSSGRRSRSSSPTRSASGATPSS